MKKTLAVVAVFASLVAVAFVIGLLLARSAERESDLALQRFAGEASAPDRIAERNEAARQLETLARPLAIELRPRMPELTDPVEFETALMRSMTAWLRLHEERTTDTIDAPPADVAEWMAQHAATVDTVANALIHGDVPRWPTGAHMPARDWPVPNLLGHMQLLRVLSAATLDRELRGDHVGAWKLQHAAWKLTSGLFDRPEVISALVGIAGVRMSAAVQRKLEAPVPRWRAELDQRAFTTEMFDAVRLELSGVAKGARGSESLFYVVDRADRGRQLPALAAEAIASPVVRWGVAENMRAAFEQLNAVRTNDPCLAARQRISAAIEASTPALARRFGRTFMPNLTAAIGRGALADLAVEGTSKVLALKTARADDPDAAWPSQNAAIAHSRCKGEQWVYAVDENGGMTLRFSGEIPTPANFQGSKIPTEFVAEGREQSARSAE